MLPKRYNSLQFTLDRKLSIQELSTFYIQSNIPALEWMFFDKQHIDNCIMHFLSNTFHLLSKLIKSQNYNTFLHKKLHYTLVFSHIIEQFRLNKKKNEQKSARQEKNWNKCVMVSACDCHQRFCRMFVLFFR